MTSKRYRIGDICELVRGTSPTLKTLPGQYPLVVTADFRRTSESWQLNGPAVCIPLVSSTGHGDAALHRVHYQDGKFALANLLVALLPKDHTVCDTKFLYHLLMVKKNEVLVPLMIGTANVSLKERDIAGVEISLPPVPEQRRIVARIEELAAKINEARGLREKAEEEAEAFVTSFHATLAGTRMKKLDDILRLDEDLAAVTPTGSYPQVGVKSFGAGLFAKSAVLGSETTYKTFNRLYEGALVLSQVKGWEGAVAICPADLEGWFVSPEYRTFRCVADEARPGYLAPLVRTRWFWEKLGRATRGVGARRERTRPEQFLKIEMSIPTIEKQIQGECLFAQVSALKKVQAETAAELDGLLPSILDKVFAGRL